MSVNWVQDVLGNYEISSVNHLLQLMHEGTLFTDTGTSPSSYLSSNYVQTVDVDLASEHASIVPIGSVSDADFTGGYDGQNHSISNWSFDAAGYSLEIGFICVLSGAVVKNLVLDGVWVFLNGGDAGFLVGRTRSVAGIYNITTNFASGTRLVGGVTGSLGVIVGNARSVSIHNVTVGGIIDECSGNAAVGGVIGYASGGGQISHLRNIATFTTPIQGGSYVGGIAGNFDLMGSQFMNAMTGDILNGAGIFGRLRNSVSDVVNSMRGNATAGIAGSVIDQTLTRVMNYMTGDAVYGLYGNVGTSTIEKSVVAMNGTTQYAAIPANAGSSEILLDTSFGLVAEFTNDTITTMDLSSFDGVDPGTGLPYISFAFTDPVGNFIDWAFIFGNVPPFSLTARPLSIAVSFLAIDGAVAYRVTVQETGGPVVTVTDGFSGLSISANDLKSETEYTVRLLSTSDNSSYTLQYEETITTLENIPENYDISDYQIEEGVYDISDDSAGTAFLGTVLNDVFTTGDELIVSLPSGAPRQSTFVERGDSYPIKDEDALIIPFDADAGASQSVSIILSDSSSVAVVYDEVNEAVSIGGTTYSSADSTIIDGRKITILNI